MDGDYIHIYEILFFLYPLLSKKMLVCIVSLSIVLKGWKNGRYIGICSRLSSLVFVCRFFFFYVCYCSRLVCVLLWVVLDALMVLKSLFSVAVALALLWVVLVVLMVLKSLFSVAVCAMSVNA